MPKITAFYAALHALLLLALAARIVRYRLTARIGLGVAGDRALEQRMRVHGNAVEYVPIALILLLLLELSALPVLWLHVFGGGLLLARVLHAIGLSRHSGMSFGRFQGTLWTWAAIIAMSFTLLARLLLLP